MPTTTLMPLPKQQYLTALGTPLVGGKVYTFAAGGTTPKPTYTDAAGTAEQPNPIPLNLRGEPASPIFWSGNYRVELRDTLNNLVYSVDNYNSDPFNIAGLVSSAGAALIGYLQNGVGAVIRSVQDRLRDRVSVLDFMPAGFDYANFGSEAYVQSALNAALAANKNLEIPVRIKLTGPVNIDRLTDTHEPDCGS